jgi:hypothetical protein
MDPTIIGAVVFVFVFGGALLGMRLRIALPEHHLNAESKYIVKMGMGLVGTMVALLLGLLIASAKNFYDTQAYELKQASAKVILLDRVLAHYGPGGNAARARLRETVAVALQQRMSARVPSLQQMSSRGPAEAIYEEILGLQPKDEFHHAVQSQALTTASELGHLRWMMFAERTTSVSSPMLVIVIFWLTIIFLSFGLFAPPNATVIGCLLVCSLSVSVAVFLILELYTPYEGWIQVSIAPLRAALEQLGR